MCHLVRRQIVHLEQLYEKYTVFVHGLRAMRGEPPVRGQVGPVLGRDGRSLRRKARLRIESVEAQHGIRISNINRKQHFFA